MISPEEIAGRPRRWCTRCLCGGEHLEPRRVEAVAVEHGTEYGSRFVCRDCACAAAARDGKLEPLEDFWNRVAAADAVERLVGRP